MSMSGRLLCVLGLHRLERRSVQPRTLRHEDILRWAYADYVIYDICVRPDCGWACGVI